MPNTQRTPHSTMVSTMRSLMVAGRSGSCGMPTQTPSSWTSTGKGGHALVEAAGRLAGERVVVPTVPGAAQPALLDRALAERAALVRAVVVEGAILALVVGQADRLVATRDGLDPALG